MGLPVELSAPSAGGRENPQMADRGRERRDRPGSEPPASSTLDTDFIDPSEHKAAMVLVVEDQQLVRDSVAAVLRSVRLRRSGRQGRKAGPSDPQRWALDAMVLDLRMPDLDGAGVGVPAQKPSSQLILGQRSRTTLRWCVPCARISGKRAEESIQHQVATRALFRVESRPKRSRSMWGNALRAPSGRKQRSHSSGPRHASSRSIQRIPDSVMILLPS